MINNFNIISFKFSIYYLVNPLPAAILLCFSGSPFIIKGADISKNGLSLGGYTLILLATCKLCEVSQWVSETVT